MNRTAAIVGSVGGGAVTTTAMWIFLYFTLGIISGIVVSVGSYYIIKAIDKRIKEKKEK